MPERQRWDSNNSARVDCTLYIQCREEDATRLKEAIRSLPLPGFRREEKDDRDWYVEEEGSSSWIYNYIQVKGPSVSLNRGYGGHDYPATLIDAEHSVIEAVLDGPALEVTHWSLVIIPPLYSDPLYFKEGDSRESLRAELGW